VGLAEKFETEGYSMLVPDLCHLDATAQAAMVRQGELTPGELMEHAIACIERLNPHINAVVTPMFEEARAAALRPSDGPFSGVPFLLKDTASYANVRCTYGSALFAERISLQDNELVRRYRQAGLLIAGKTNTPEFGIQPTTEPRLFGATRNPWQPDLTPGGSSGGAAAAVAAGMVAAAHGSDGGGSLRIPASCCGLFGLKPSRGRMPPGPDGGDLLGGLVAPHVLTRSVRDSAALLDATAGPEAGLPSPVPPPSQPFAAAALRPPERLRIGWSVRSPLGGPVHPDCVAAVQEVVSLCTELGHEVEEHDIVLDAEQVSSWFTTMWAVGSTQALAVYEARGQQPPADMVEPLTWALFERARHTPAPLYELARGQLQRVAYQIVQSVQHVDIWLSPTLAQPPVPLGTFAPAPDDPMQAFWRAFDFTPFTAMFNLTGQPAASVPLHWNAAGLPIGVHIAGHFGAEATLLQLAAQLEQARPWEQHRPLIHCANIS
jgi:amidase